MEIYSSSNRCAKCGGGESADKYHDGRSVGCISPMSLLKVCPGSGKGEHISRYCKRCGFVWVEACVDSAGKATD